MILMHQLGREPVEMKMVNSQLTGPAPVPLIPYHYTCTNQAEQGALQRVGVRARLQLPPGTKSALEIEMEAKK